MYRFIQQLFESEAVQLDEAERHVRRSKYTQGRYYSDPGSNARRDIMKRMRVSFVAVLLVVGLALGAVWG
jgi:hypothetical protein